MPPGHGLQADEPTTEKDLLHGVHVLYPAKLYVFLAHWVHVPRTGLDKYLPGVHC